MLRRCETENGTKIFELLQAGASGHKGAWETFENNSGSRRWQSSCKGGWKIAQKRRITRKEHQRLLNKFEMEGFMTQKGWWNLARNKVLQDRGALPQEEGDTIRE